MFNSFCKEATIEKKTKIQQAEAFMWFHLMKTGQMDITISEVNEYFIRASLPKLNSTRIREEFIKSKRVCKGSQPNTFRLVRSAIEEYNLAYSHIFEEEVKVVDKAGINNSPYLNEADFLEAYKMAELYLILYCYENSVRRVIETVLINKLGENWWNIASNNPLRNKVNSRKEVESKNKFLTPRGNSPLFYIDWGDLLSLIRKYENEFLPLIKDIKFVELRFEEMERIRNIIAHNGFLTSEDDYQRIVLSFRDWCKQLK